MADSVARAPRSSVSRHDCKALVLGANLLRSVDTKLGRQLAAAASDSSRHGEIVTSGVDPRSYTSPDLFWRDWMCVNLLRKFPKLNLGIDTGAVAMEAFRKSEELCAATNLRLSRPYDTPTCGVSAMSFIETARRKIWMLLGDFSWADAEVYLGFSGGATTRQRRALGDSYYKFLGKRDVTRQAALAGICAMFSSPRWKRSLEDQFGLDPYNWVNVVQGSRLTTVPKNAKTDRVIAIEPCMNMYLQRGIGGLLRTRLKTVGIDLDDQGRNQRLAYCASVNDDLATLDLSAASDSISTELVRALMPPSWFSAMDMVRSTHGSIRSASGSSEEVVVFQKFSSMGNGFTFELESLIFWALVSSVVDFYAGEGRRTVAVYGDDIIVSNRISGHVIELLQYCGFSCNVEKSFEAGPFRESCGKHYFLGVDVTPIYISDPIANGHRLLWFANSVRRWANRPTPGICDPRFYKIWKRIVDCVPAKYRNFIPEGMGDGGLIGTFSEALPKRREGYWVARSWVEVSSAFKAQGDQAVLRALSGHQRRETTVNPFGLRVDTAHDPVVSHRYRFNRSGVVLLGDSRSLLEDVTIHGKKRRSKILQMEILQWSDPGIWPVAGA